jgi:RNA polymerase sigma factor (sigma-70 family)
MLLDYLRRLVPSTSDTPADGELLARFAAARDEAAFETLVRRHGPMVWGVCLRLLADTTDAEDAFQTTFLVLARKAAAIGRRELVANWLHGVALRTARKLRCLRARRRSRERQVSVMPEPSVLPRDVWAEVSPVLDTELARLAEKYRQPILLCYLEGLTRQEAAAVLGWPPGTVAGRLSRALDLLRKRLSSRGLALPASVLAAALAERASTAAVPATLVAAVTKAAPVVAVKGWTTGVVSGSVAALAKGTLSAMNTAKLIRTVATLLVLGLTAVSGAVLLSHAPAGEQPAPGLAAGNGAGAGTARPAQASEQPQQKGPAKGTEGEAKPKRLSPQQALQLIREYLQTDKRAQALLDQLQIKEQTTPALWDKLQTQLFQVDHPKGVPFMDTFVIRNQVVTPIHPGLPGFRFTSYCVADLRGDGKPLLVYSYSWGSGDLRAEVAALDVRSKEPKPVVTPQKLVLDPTHDWQVKTVDERSVRVEGGSVHFGDLEYQEKDGKPALRLKLRDDLPEALRKKVQEMPAPDGGQAGKPGPAKLTGTWKPVVIESNGKAIGKADQRDDWAITEKDFKTWLPEEGNGHFAYKVGETETLNTIDFTVLQSGVKGPKQRVYLGIWALEGDTLKICYALPGFARPTAFATKPDSGQTLFVLKRVSAPTPAEVKKLIAELGDADFAVRQRATKRLIEAGKEVLPALRAALPAAEVEVQRRLEAIIDRIEK